MLTTKKSARPIRSFVEPLEDRILFNLVVNPNFTNGNTGFLTELMNNQTNLFENSYAITTDPHIQHSGGASFGDHTSHTGLMMAINSPAQSTTMLWQEKIPCTPGTTYNFYVWAASWGKLGGNTDPSPAQLQININGTIIATKTLNATDGQWLQIPGTWRPATNTLATITINDLNTAGVGNDFAIDDILFSPQSTTPTTFAVSGSVFNDTTTNGKRDAGEAGMAGWMVYIDGNSNGQFDPGETYVITDTNGNYKLNLKPGTYRLSVQVRQGYYQTSPHTLSYTANVTNAPISNEIFGVKAIAPI